jgi:hypothetical protein
MGFVKISCYSHTGNRCFFLAPQMEVRTPLDWILSKYIKTNEIYQSSPVTMQTETKQPEKACVPPIHSWKQAPPIFRSQASLSAQPLELRVKV